MAYSIRVREEGRGKGSVHRFATLAELQKYVRDRWQGVEYIDSPTSFHSDYCTFDITGATLKDLGKRDGERGTQEYWNWTWHELAAEPPKAKHQIATLLRADGSEVEITSKARKFSLQELQSLVGGYIELVPRMTPEHKSDIFCNEEGRLRGLPYNEKASVLTGQLIVGDVIIMRGSK